MQARIQIFFLKSKGGGGEKKRGGEVKRLEKMCIIFLQLLKPFLKMRHLVILKIYFDHNIITIFCHFDDEDIPFG